MMKRPVIAVIDNGVCNLRSVTKALENEGADVRVIWRPGEMKGMNAGGLVLPGVGALRDCAAVLKGRGFDGLIRDWIGEGKPFFGVCLGMQVLFEFSEEGNVEGLGIFKGKVMKFRLPAEYKIPHMGWNTVKFLQKGTAVQAGLKEEGEWFYFVHSYHCVPEEEGLKLAASDYGGEFVAAIARGNCFATQFHPEKSQGQGLRLYRNFVGICGC